MLRYFCVIFIIDQHFGQGIAVQFHPPAAAEIFRQAFHQDVRDCRLDDKMLKFTGWARVQLADLGDHIVKIGFIDPAQVGQLFMIMGGD